MEMIKNNILCELSEFKGKENRFLLQDDRMKTYRYLLSLMKDTEIKV